MMMMMMITNHQLDPVKLVKHGYVLLEPNGIFDKLCPGDFRILTFVMRSKIHAVSSFYKCILVQWFYFPSAGSVAPAFNCLLYAPNADI